jgi:hypothetical protein
MLILSELEDAPSQQLSYNLTKTLFRIALAMPAFESKAQQVFMDYLDKIGTVFATSINRQGPILVIITEPRRQSSLVCHSLSHWQL